MDRRGRHARGWIEARFRKLGPVLTALVLAVAAGCERIDEAGPRVPIRDLPSQEVRNFVLEETEEGRLEWILRARYAASYSRNGAVRAKTIAIDFYDRQGKPYSHLVADEGIVQQPAKDMEARGNVVVTTRDGVRVETSSLRYLNRPAKIVSDSYVRWTRDGNVVSGIGFESDPSLEHFTLKREVRAQVQSEGSGLRFRER